MTSPPLFKLRQNGLSGNSPVPRITIARGAKDQDPWRIPELAAEKARQEGGPIAPVRLKRLENRSAPKEIRASFPSSPGIKIDKAIEEKQRRLNMLERDTDNREMERKQLSDRVTQLEWLNAKVEEEKDEKQAKLMALQMQMSQREADRRELQHRVSRLEMHNRRIEEQIGSKEEKLKLLEKEILQRDREKTELREKVSTLQRQNVEATESKQEKERRLKELEMEISIRNTESQELRNKVADLETLTAKIEQEKAEKQNTLSQLQEVVDKREMERRELEGKIALLEAQNRQMEEEKRVKEERLRKLESEQAEKEAVHHGQELNGGDAADCIHLTETADTELEEKMKKLQELEAAVTKHEAEREELKYIVISLPQRNEEMDREQADKQCQLTELQFDVAKRETENYDLKQKLSQLETLQEKLLEGMARKERAVKELLKEAISGRRREENLEQMRLALEHMSEARDMTGSRQFFSESAGADRQEEFATSTPRCEMEDTHGNSLHESHTHTTTALEDSTRRPKPTAFDPSLLAVNVVQELPSHIRDRPPRSYSPPLPPPPLPAVSYLSDIAELDYSIKYRLKCLTREEEVQEKHVYLPEEKDTLNAVNTEGLAPPASAQSAISSQSGPQGQTADQQKSDMPSSAGLSQFALTCRQQDELDAGQDDIVESEAKENEMTPTGDDDNDDEDTIPEEEKELTRTKQKLEEIEKEVVVKRAETEYLRKSVEDLLSLMDAADEEDSDQEPQYHIESDDDDDDDSSSNSNMSDEYFVEVDLEDLQLMTQGQNPTSTVGEYSGPAERVGDITAVKIKLLELELEVVDKKTESERLKRVMEDLELKKMVAAEEKKLTVQKLEDLQKSESQLKQQLAILQLRRATENERTSDDDEDESEEDMEDGKDDGEEKEEDSENISELEKQALRDAIVY